MVGSLSRPPRVALLGRPGTRVALTWVVVVAVLAGLPWLGIDAFWARQIQLIGILALLVSGLNLSFGFAGELALGQAATYAAGAYAAGWVSINVVNDVIVAIAAGVVAALVVGLLSGVPGLRVGGWVLAIASFFFLLLIPDLVQIFPDSALGGTLGLSGIPRPRLLGSPLDVSSFYVVVIVVVALWMAVFRNLAVSRYGSAFLVLRESPTLASSLGISPYGMKLRAYALGAVPAGAAGALFACLDSYVSPDSFTINLTIAILAASILGGAGSVYGVLVGATIMQLGPLQSTSFEQYSLLVYGIFLVVGGLLLQGGVAGLAHRAWRAARPSLSRRGPVEAGMARVGARAESAFPDLAGTTLSVSSVSKRFGGNQAVDGVSFEAAPGKVTALIGPNGSGKTTVLNLISGLYAADSGQITLGGERLTGRAAHRVAAAGVARTFQTPSIPDGLSVRQVTANSRFALDRASIGAVALRLPRYRRVARSDRRSVDESLAAVGILDRAEEPARALALGTRRLLELARALCARPRLVLLDEIASGLDVEELEELTDVIRRLRAAGATIVLVEHNFALVRSLADEIVVLAEGRVIATGTPSEIEADPQVKSQYLGERPEVPVTKEPAR